MSTWTRTQPGTQVRWGAVLPHLSPLYSPRPHLPSSSWSEQRHRCHFPLSWCPAPWHPCGEARVAEVRVSCPQTGAHPSPTAARPALPRSGRATHLSLLSLGMAQGVGSNLRPGEHRAGDGVRTAGRGDQGPPARPGHPSPSRAGGGGSLPGRSGKWPMGPGWHVTRGAASSPRYRVRTRGGGAARHPETPAGPSPPSAPGLPRSPPQHLL